MKNTVLKSGLFILCFLISGFYAFAQDTIYYKKTGSIVVLVKEVSQTEVQYKKVEMPDGPMYIINKADISKIVYKNGYTEVIKEPVAEQQQQTVTTTTTPFTVYTPQDVNLDKITYSDTKLRPSSIIRLIDRHPDPNRRPALMEVAHDMKSLKRHQDGTRTGAIIFGAFTIAGGVLYAALESAGAFDYSGAGSIDNTIFIAPPAAFGALAVILGGTSIAMNINLKKKRRDFVDLYNK